MQNVEKNKKNKKKVKDFMAGEEIYFEKMTDYCDFYFVMSYVHAKILT